ncbi:hypothetical protein AbraIFM66951_003063 [Aspergillus brasiliensis]|uniref:RRM domain-containing protein n=1 Tax=Aspergillus brasiliensis TaxID=319629 RepID=A0A9W5YRJ0_9EURO|nr:hypothetical protein AbraCBS73388_006379 [Aspergillus brasiliensis]GKZ42914.1 hypothetical protein AbraIFM66951_003063 [Aspergillus brasiliensis]
MDSKLYAGNLSYDVTDQDLINIFGDYGKVTETVIPKDEETDRSRGFGFVTMSTPEEAEAAIDSLDGYDFRGKSLRVVKATRQGDTSD